MEPLSMSRRRLLASGAGLAAFPYLASSPEALAAAKQLRLDDPDARARVRASIIGSTVAQDVHAYSRLHIYAHQSGQKALPLCSMMNYTVTRWQPTADGRFEGRHYEVGVYTEFDSDTPITRWVNPITGEEREVWQFAAGPLQITIGPDGAETGEHAVVKPESMAMELIGDHIFLPTQSSFSFPCPLKPDKWPKESPGDMFFWDSFFTLSARTDDLLNPDIASAPSQSQFQNLVSWHPWLGMGQRPGRTFGRAFGAKLSGPSALPPKVLAAIEKHKPEILDIDNWTGQRNDFSEFMAKRKPT